IPYVGELRLGGVSAPYVARGKAKPFFLAGLQNHTDRQLRLLAVIPWVKKRRMHFYSADRGIVCTGRRAQPPRDFVEEEMDALDLAAAPGAPDRFTCGHEGRDAVALAWRDAGGGPIERCAECRPAAERALRAALAAHEGHVVIDKATSARALAELWSEHGMTMLEAAANGDGEVAARLHKEKIASEEATELIRRADREGAHRSVVA